MHHAGIQWYLIVTVGFNSNSYMQWSAFKLRLLITTQELQETCQFEIQFFLS